MTTTDFNILDFARTLAAEQAVIRASQPSVVELAAYMSAGEVADVVPIERGQAYRARRSGRGEGA